MTRAGMGYSFFLYGVYSEGQKCFSRFQNFITHSQPAYVKGTLYKLNCGLPLLSSQGGYMIPGSLVELNLQENHWPIIDSLNGFNAMNAKKSLVVRETVDVVVAEGGVVNAQTYCLCPDKKMVGCREFMDTEYANYVQSENSSENSLEQSLVNRLTERQKTYIQKLSQAKGREIVPVDMALYRELMSLELIVDKGRRLALTNLGQEISFFL